MRTGGKGVDGSLGARGTSWRDQPASGEFSLECKGLVHVRRFLQRSPDSVCLPSAGLPSVLGHRLGTEESTGPFPSSFPVELYFIDLFLNFFATSYGGQFVRIEHIVFVFNFLLEKI